MFINKNIKIKLTILFFLFVFLVTSGFGCKYSKKEREISQPITLKYWRTWDDKSDFSEIINAYRAIHPNVKIEYRRFRYEEYENALLEAMAEDRGPDIFSIHNTWVNKYRTKLLPAPGSVTLPYERMVKRLGIKKEKIIETRTTKLLTPAQLTINFIDVVYDDVVWPDFKDGRDKIYALPLSVDTLVLFYNRDILNRANIPEPPQTWSEFQNQVKKIVKQDKRGDIIQAGAALGTANNISRSFDILSVLMMQNGTQMVKGKSVTLAATPLGAEKREIPPGEEALIFYTDFAYPAKEVYTWNEEMPDSLDAFLSGQTAFFFGYSYHLQEIKNRAAKLNFGYLKLPQIEGSARETNYANYWVEGVSKKTANADWAWDFIYFAASSERVKKYLDKTGKPTALRSLVSVQAESEALLPFVSQLLTAKSWYKGKDSAMAEDIFKEMISSVVNAEMTPREAINLAAKRMQQTM